MDDDEQLAADLVAPRYSIDSQGRRVVQPKADTKKRLGRSPDRADAVLLSFAVESGTVTAYVGFMPSLIREPVGASVTGDGPLSYYAKL